MNLPNLSPYSLALKLAGIGLVVLLVFGFFLSWSRRGQEIVRLTAWQNAVVISATDATVQPDAKGLRKSLTAEQVPAAIAALKRSWDSCSAAAAENTRLAEEGQQRAENADKALANVQVLMKGQYESSEKRIEALAHAKAQPTPELQCQAVGADSKAAWEAWK